MMTANQKDLILTLQGMLRDVPHKMSQLYICVGTQGAGKTHFFEQSTLAKLESAAPDETELCVWYDKSALFVEIPEVITNSPPLLKRFIKTLRKYCISKAQQSICVFINIHKAIEESPKQFVSYLKEYGKKLDGICHLLNVKPNLHLIFTHLDKIAGFCHTFQNSTESWGYHFSPYLNHTSLVKQNTQQYQQLLKQLHQSLIPRLHICHDNLSKYLIREFPLQMESMGNMIKACVNHLSSSEATTTGVYFTSATQGNATHDRLSSNIAQSYELAISHQIPQSSIDKPYFIEDTIKQLKLCHTSSIQRSNKKLYPVAATAILVFGLGLSWHHYHTKQILVKTNNVLSKYKSFKGASLGELLPALEEVNQAQKSLSRLQGVLPLKNIKALDEQIQNNYNHRLTDDFLPTVVSHIELVLKKESEPKLLYNALRVYLMLSEPKKLDKPFVLSWFKQFWKAQHITKAPKLESLLSQVLTHDYKGANIQIALVQSVRNFLNELPLDKLYFHLIDDHFDFKGQTLKTPNFNISQFVIPDIYTKKNAQNIATRVIPNALTSYVNDSFVLKQDLTRLIPSVQKVYLANYKAYWSQVVKQLQPKSFNSYHQAIQLLSSLSSDNSPLDKLYSAIQENTSAFGNIDNSFEKLFNHSVAAKFTQVNLFTSHQLSRLKPIFSDLVHYFKTLDIATDAKKNAFEIAKSRFDSNIIDPISQLQEIKRQLPKPLGPWMEEVATNAWSLILQDAQAYINQQWQNQVYQYYRDGIANHFPFVASNHNTDVTKEAFVEFFGPYGKLKQFFDYHLASFIDTSDSQWKPIIKDGLKLPISDDIIKELIRANVIREMFFHNDNYLPVVKFTLHALNLEPIIQEFTISINGQTLTETQQSRQSLEFVWPGHQNLTSTKLSLKTLSGESFEVQEEGYWSWFKLLTKANVHQYGDDMKNFHLLFNLNGNSSKFLLVADTPLNPFIPGMLTQFKLPEKIS